MACATSLGRQVRQPAGLRSFNDSSSVGSNAVAGGDGTHQRVVYFRLEKLPVEGGDKGRKHPFASVGHGEGTDFCPAGGEGLREGGFHFFGRKAAFKGIDGEQDFFHGGHNISLAIHAQASASASAW